ncbi:MAG: glycosyltransferase family 2 protein [Hyphomicrobiaceae bacterium]|nr:glycosyltransferase family 2 protein [Hyphomicrobiaceae bacterium]
MKVSVVTVAYNAVRTIAATVRSVAEQGHADLEHIIVDGGSTDGTLDLLSLLGHPRLTWRSGRDGGIYDAMNTGVARASGDAVIFLNADDRFAASDVVAAAVGAFSAAGEADLVWGHVLAEAAGGPKRLPQPPALDRRVLARTTICHQAMFARRRLFERIGGFDVALPIVADWEWLYRATMIAGVAVCHIDRDIAVIGVDGVSHTVDFEAEKRAALARYYSPLEIALWRRLPLAVRRMKRQVRGLAASPGSSGG